MLIMSPVTARWMRAASCFEVRFFMVGVTPLDGHLHSRKRAGTRNQPQISQTMPAHRTRLMPMAISQGRGDEYRITPVVCCCFEVSMEAPFERSLALIQKAMQEQIMQIALTLTLFHERKRGSGEA